ncbi:MAG: SecD/SecF family protein translocase subunit [Firmicutes bacterium]|nr:SecD/SecF family protein translocase subunit [Bacillota bacterium]
MTKTKAIVRLCMVIFLVGIGITLTFVSFRIPVINNGTGTWESSMGAISERMGIDLRGGVLAVFYAEPNPETQAEGSFQDQLRATVRRLESTLGQRGFVEATVVIQGGNRIRIEVPGLNDSEELMDVIGRPADIDFRLSGGTDNDIFLTGRHIQGVSTHQAGLGEWGVRLHFTNEGGNLFRDAVQTEGVGGTIRIFSNGQQISAPRIDSTDAGRDNTAIITSPEFRTERDAEELVTRIESGLFEVRLRDPETSIIPPTLGEGAITAGIIAFIVGLLFMFIFMFLLYGDLGLLSNLSMLIYSVLFLGALATFNAVQLTLPGIAGIILALAMAVDANIIIFERIKDEFRSGKRMGVAVESGFNKSIATIFDANITTIIAAVVLFLLGTGPIRGFAIVLLLGVVISMFCSLVVLRSLAKTYLFINPHNAKRLRLSQIKTVDGTRVEVQVKKKERKLNV